MSRATGAQRTVRRRRRRTAPLLCDSAPGGALIDAGLGASGRRTNVLLAYGRRIELAGQGARPGRCRRRGRAGRSHRAPVGVQARCGSGARQRAQTAGCARLPRGPRGSLAWSRRADRAHGLLAAGQGAGEGGSGAPRAAADGARPTIAPVPWPAPRRRGRRGVAVAMYAVGRRGRDRVPVAVAAYRRGRDGSRFDYRFRRSFAPFAYRFRVQRPTRGSLRRLVRLASCASCRDVSSGAAPSASSSDSAPARADLERGGRADAVGVAHGDAELQAARLACALRSLRPTRTAPFASVAVTVRVPAGSVTRSSPSFVSLIALRGSAPRAGPRARAAPACASAWP